MPELQQIQNVIKSRNLISNLNKTNIISNANIRKPPSFYNKALQIKKEVEGYVKEKGLGNINITAKDFQVKDNTIELKDKILRDIQKRELKRKVEDFIKQEGLPVSISPNDFIEDNTGVKLKPAKEKEIKIQYYTKKAQEAKEKLEKKYNIHLDFNKAFSINEKGYKINEDYIQQVLKNKQRKDFLNKILKEKKDVFSQVNYYPSLQDVVIENGKIKLSDAFINNLNQKLSELKEKKKEEEINEYLSNLNNSLKDLGLTATIKDLNIQENNGKLEISLKPEFSSTIELLKKKKEEELINKYLQDVNNKLDRIGYPFSATRKDIVVVKNGNTLTIQLKDNFKKEINDYLIEKAKERLEWDLEHQLGIDIDPLHDFLIEDGKVVPNMYNIKRKLIQKKEKEYEEKLENFLGIDIDPNKAFIVNDNNNNITIQLNKDYFKQLLQNMKKNVKSTQTLKYKTISDLINDLKKKPYITNVEWNGRQLVVYKSNGRKNEYWIENVEGIPIVAGLEWSGKAYDYYRNYIRQTGDLSKLFQLREAYEFKEEKKTRWEREGRGWEAHWGNRDEDAWEDVDKWDEIRERKNMGNKAKTWAERIANASSLTELRNILQQARNDLINTSINFVRETGDIDYEFEDDVKKIQNALKVIPDEKRLKLMALLGTKNINIDLQQLNNLKKDLVNTLMNSAINEFRRTDNETAKQLQKRVHELLNEARTSNNFADYMHYLTKAEKVNKELASLKPSLSYSPTEINLIANADFLNKINKFNKTINLLDKVKILKEIKQMPQSTLISNQLKNINEKLNIALNMPKTQKDYKKIYDNLFSNSFKSNFGEIIETKDKNKIVFKLPNNYNNQTINNNLKTSEDLKKVLSIFNKNVADIIQDKIGTSFSTLKTFEEFKRYKPLFEKEKEGTFDINNINQTVNNIIKENKNKILTHSSITNSDLFNREKNLEEKRQLFENSLSYKVNKKINEIGDLLISKENETLNNINNIINKTTPPLVRDIYNNVIKEKLIKPYDAVFKFGAGVGKGLAETTIAGNIGLLEDIRDTLSGKDIMPRTLETVTYFLKPSTYTSIPKNIKKPEWLGEVVGSVVGLKTAPDIISSPVEAVTNTFNEVLHNPIKEVEVSIPKVIEGSYKKGKNIITTEVNIPIQITAKGKTGEILVKEVEYPITEKIKINPKENKIYKEYTLETPFVKYGEKSVLEKTIQTYTTKNNVGVTTKTSIFIERPLKKVIFNKQNNVLKNIDYTKQTALDLNYPYISNIDILKTVSKDNIKRSTLKKTTILERDKTPLELKERLFDFEMPKRILRNEGKNTQYLINDMIVRKYNLNNDLVTTIFKNVEEKKAQGFKKIAPNPEKRTINLKGFEKLLSEEKEKKFFTPERYYNEGKTKLKLKEKEDNLNNQILEKALLESKIKEELQTIPKKIKENLKTNKNVNERLLKQNLLEGAKLMGSLGQLGGTLNTRNEDKIKDIIKEKQINNQNNQKDNVNDNLKEVLNNLRETFTEKIKQNNKIKTESIQYNNQNSLQNKLQNTNIKIINQRKQNNQQQTLQERIYKPKPIQIEDLFLLNNYKQKEGQRQRQEEKEDIDIKPLNIPKFNPPLPPNIPTPPKFEEEPYPFDTKPKKIKDKKAKPTEKKKKQRKTVKVFKEFEALNPFVYNSKKITKTKSATKKVRSKKQRKSQRKKNK